MKQATFKEEGYKSIRCPNCNVFIKISRLDEKEVKLKKCPKCKSSTLYFPPRKGISSKGEKLIFFGPLGGTWTADYTKTMEDEDFFAKELAKLTEDERQRLFFGNGLTDKEIEDIFNKVRV